jgi:hypothetical protein
MGSGDSRNSITKLIPSLESYANETNNVYGTGAFRASEQVFSWHWIVWSIAIGAAVLLLRLTVSFLAFLRLQKKARLLISSDVNLYHVNDAIIPFSFGKAVFINHQSHSETELREIIRHELVHVRQKHSIDIIWSELLCILNWYNPFAWLLKSAIRQNLEFIADNKTLESGVDAKQYQYLLLKVVGNNEFSIAPKFNFSSLKKRIVMMNKLKTARIHLLRFLFIVPLLGVLLISFRKELPHKSTAPVTQTYAATAVETDTLPPELNKKGFELNVVGRKSNAMVIVIDRDNKVVDRIPLDKWNDDETYYENKYGELPAPPVPATPALPPPAPDPIELPANVHRIDVTDKKATVDLKDGKKEVYDLNKPSDKEAFEKKYGPVIPAAPTPPVPPRKRGSYVMADINEAVIVGTPAGNKEKITVAAVAPVAAIATGAENIAAIASPAKVSVSPATVGVVADDITVMQGEEKVLLVITRKTTKKELENFVQALKEKGIDLKFTNMDFNDGVLNNVRGSIELNDNKAIFSATDFSKVTVSSVEDGDKVYFRINISERHRQI